MIYHSEIFEPLIVSRADRTLELMLIVKVCSLLRWFVADKTVALNLELKLCQNPKFPT